jgi:hypothetical protein
MSKYSWNICNLFRKSTATGSVSRIVYSLPCDSVFRKFYNKDILFRDVDWKDWDGVIDGFRNRFGKWYFDKIAGGDASYVDFCALCALVEVFSHYDAARDWHDPGNYKEFLRKLDSKFRMRLSEPITITRCEAGVWKVGKLKDIADVFYSGVRCSLHHHGDLASYAGLAGTGELAKVHTKAGASQCGVYIYTLVVFDPQVLKGMLEGWLAKYCDKLKAEPSGPVAANFRKTFLNDYGIAIPVP